MNKIDIAVVDYGMGNLRSVSKALEHVAPEKSVVVTSNPEELMQAERVVFPGQGAMPDCIRELDARGLREAVIHCAKNKPFLGICIGLQMLFDRSEEGDAAGLGIFAGSVKKFLQTDMHVLNAETQQSEKLKVPHMGWNEVYQVPVTGGVNHALLQNIKSGERFYYVHSYYVAPSSPSLMVGYSEYPRQFTSAIAQENLFAVQFHPEKSAQAGLQLLQNFVQWQP